MYIPAARCTPTPSGNRRRRSRRRMRRAAARSVLSPARSRSRPAASSWIEIVSSAWSRAERRLRAEAADPHVRRDLDPRAAISSRHRRPSVHDRPISAVQPGSASTTGLSTSVASPRDGFAARHPAHTANNTPTHDRRMSAVYRPQAGSRAVPQHRPCPGSRSHGGSRSVHRGMLRPWRSSATSSCSRSVRHVTRSSSGGFARIVTLGFVTEVPTAPTRARRAVQPARRDPARARRRRAARPAARAGPTPGRRRARARGRGHHLRAACRSGRSCRVAAGGGRRRRRVVDATGRPLTLLDPVRIVRRALELITVEPATPASSTTDR